VDEPNDPVGDALRAWSGRDDSVGAAPLLRMAGLFLGLVAIALVAYAVLDRDTYGQRARPCR
jgi:hypothetical protein